MPSTATELGPSLLQALPAAAAGTEGLAGQHRDATD